MNVSDEPLFLSKKGVYALAPRDYQSERNAQLRSFFINGKDGRGLLFEDLTSASFALFGGFLAVGTNKRLYLLDTTQDSRAYSGEYSQRQYEGYVFENVRARVLFTKDDRLYFGDEEGAINTFYENALVTSSYVDGDGQIVTSRWETPYISGSNAIRKKTFTFIARVLSAFTRTGDEVWAERLGVWKKIVEQNDEARYFDFSDVDFSAFTFSTDTSPKLLGQKIRLNNLQKVRFAFLNNFSEPYGLERIYGEFLTGGRVVK